MRLLIVESPWPIITFALLHKKHRRLRLQVPNSRISPFICKTLSSLVDFHFSAREEMAKCKISIALWLLALLFSPRPASTTLTQRSYASSSNVASLLPNNADYIIAGNVAPPPPNEETYFSTPFYSRKLRERFRLLKGARSRSRSSGIKLSDLSPGPSPSGEPTESPEAIFNVMTVIVCVVALVGVAFFVVANRAGSSKPRH